MEQCSNSSKMTRQDLILKIISLYPDTFKAERPEHVQSWVEMYEKAIKKNWDMERLMWFFATNYKSTVIPPAPSFFYSYKEDVKGETKSEPVPELTEEELVQSKVAKEKFLKDMEELKAKVAMPQY